jgi:membrane-bound lytic murein transglycosylase D
VASFLFSLKTNSVYFYLNNLNKIIYVFLKKQKKARIATRCKKMDLRLCKKSVCKKRMKAVTIGYMVSLLFGLPPSQTTPIQLIDAPTPVSAQTRSLRSGDLRPMERLGGRTEAAELMKVEFNSHGAEKSLAVLERITEAGQRHELKQLAANAPDARVALQSLREQPAMADYTDWLDAQLDDMEVAESAASELPSVVFQLPAPVVTRAKAVEQYIPLYDKWLRRIGGRPCPKRASELLPVVRAAFAAEGLPEALVWLAETESTFNPHARNLIGSCGLFQLMPETAKSLGLSLRPYDQRLNAATSARAAARYLKKLHGRFGDWPLALAAYNGGESRVAQALKRRGTGDFASIAVFLPVETRLYVPKVLATIKVRTGVSLNELAAPRI